MYETNTVGTVKSNGKTHTKKCFFLITKQKTTFFSSKEKIDEKKYEPLRFWGGGADLSGPTTNKTPFFMCVFPLLMQILNFDEI